MIRILRLRPGWTRARDRPRIPSEAASACDSDGLRTERHDDGICMGASGIASARRVAKSRRIAVVPDAWGFRRLMCTQIPGTGRPRLIPGELCASIASNSPSIAPAHDDWGIGDMLKRSNVVITMLHQSLTIVGLGLASGIGAALLSTRALESVLRGIAYTDAVEGTTARARRALEGRGSRPTSQEKGE
jgi:hypothetical protein